MDKDYFYARLNALCLYWDRQVLGKTGPRLGMDFDGMTQSVRLGYHTGRYDDVLGELGGWQALMAKRTIVTEGRQTPLRRHAFYVARKLQDLGRLVEEQIVIADREQGVERRR